jgi:hypothetical protein
VRRTGPELRGSTPHEWARWRGFSWSLDDQKMPEPSCPMVQPPNLTLRPAKPALGRGRVQRGALRALRLFGTMATSEIMPWVFPRKVYRGERLASVDLGRLQRACRRAFRAASAFRAADIGARVLGSAARCDADVAARGSLPSCEALGGAGASGGARMGLAPARGSATWRGRVGERRYRSRIGSHANAAFLVDCGVV